jgi:hypothetical protein
LSFVSVLIKEKIEKNNYHLTKGAILASQTIVAMEKDTPTPFSIEQRAPNFAAAVDTSRVAESRFRRFESEAYGGSWLTMDSSVLYCVERNISIMDSPYQNKIYLQSPYDEGDSSGNQSPDFTNPSSSMGGKVKPSQDDCLNVVSWRKCFTVSDEQEHHKRRRYKFHLGFMNSVEALRQWHSNDTRAIE